MIDFLKILVTDISLIDDFNTNELLLWHNKQERLSHFDFETIQSKETKIYKGILFCFYENKLEILFRPHYYFNNNQHNANDFTTGNCISVISEFISDFQIAELNEFKIINLEYGINILPPIDCKELVTYISYHGKNEFRTDTQLPYSKKSYKESNNGTANKYKIIKAYSKGLQYSNFCDINTFRFEVKSKKSNYINSLGIKTITDLLNSEIYKTLSNQLLNEWNEVLILGSNTEHSNLTKKENSQLNKYLNPNNWYKLKQGHRNHFNHTKKRYFNLLEKTGYNIHTEVKNIIENKLQFLEQTCAILPPEQKEQTCADLPINIMENCTLLPIPKCKVTGLSLEHEKGGAKYIRTSTLKHLRENDILTYELLRSNFLSGTQKPKFEKNEFMHLAKQIRNRYYNPIQIKQIGYKQPKKQMQISLF